MISFSGIDSGFSAVPCPVDVDEYFVESIIDHEERDRNVKNWKLRVLWSGYEPDEDSWLNWNAVKDLAALDKYSQEHPELKLG